MLEGGPTELHKLVSARGLITPPDLGTKYHALFQYLDAQNDMTTIDRGRLEQRVEVSDPKAKRPVRRRGVARATQTRTYDDAILAFTMGSQSTELGANQDDAAAMARQQPRPPGLALMRNDRQPIIEKGKLTSVPFIPMEDRHAWEHWRCWRVALRAGNFRSVAVLSRP